MSAEDGPRKRKLAVFIVAVIGIAAVIAVSSQVGTVHRGVLNVATSRGLASFDSYYQLQRFIDANAKSAQQYTGSRVWFGGEGLPVFGPPGIATLTATQTASTASDVSSSPVFTGTNVQVQGVDELDRVKTDGKYLFVSTGHSVTVISAYPPNSASVLSTLSFPNANILGLELGQNRLVVVDQRYSNSSYIDVLLYDTVNPSALKLIQNLSVAGTFVAARLADGYLYTIIQQPSYVFGGQSNVTAVLPAVSEKGIKSDLAPSSVFYTQNNAQISFYTMISSVSIATGKDSVVSVLTGPSATVYVSTSNIYVVYTNYLDLYAADGIPGDAFTGGIVSLGDVQQAQNSTIMRATYSSGTVTVQAAGVVPGTVLNQFSLDEYNGYFRVATSRFAVVDGAATRSDDVYVLTQNMSQVSSLKNIAPGENIYAVRFVGQMGYVVTFQQIDPLFVISFKDITNPTIQSALKMNGYSDYLHPLPGGYLIGVGKDTVPASTGDYSYYLGLKLSLFRVFDNGSSEQISKFLIGDRGTDSPVLSDHLAFTFDSSRNITLVPLTLYSASGVPSNSSPPPYGDPVWQGVYIIKVNSTGFTYLGRVSQYPGQSFSYSPNGNLQIDRSVVIGDYLYTISQGEVMVSSLSSPSFPTVTTIQLAG